MTNWRASHYVLNDAKNIKKYLAPSSATSKGRLTKQWANVRSTRPKDKQKQQITKEIVMEMPHFETNVDVVPDNERASKVFCCAALADATQGTLYTDMTSSFPVQSLEGMHAFLSCMIMILTGYCYPNQRLQGWHNYINLWTSIQRVGWEMIQADIQYHGQLSQ